MIRLTPWERQPELVSSARHLPPMQSPAMSALDSVSSSLTHISKPERVFSETTGAVWCTRCTLTGNLRCLLGLAIVKAWHATVKGQPRISHGMSWVAEAEETLQITRCDIIIGKEWVTPPDKGFPSHYSTRQRMSQLGLRTAHLQLHDIILHLS